MAATRGHTAPFGRGRFWRALTRRSSPSEVALLPCDRSQAVSEMKGTASLATLSAKMFISILSWRMAAQSKQGIYIYMSFND